MSNGPTPDFNRVKLKWAGTYLDGSPITGRLLLTYNGGVMLDDDATTPVNVYPKQLAVTLTTTAVVIDGEPQQVGYAEIDVPATNDPDIGGSGGTYSLTEEFPGGRTGVTFVADKDAPGGIIWLNKVIPSAPTTGLPLTVVTYSDFELLNARVTELESTGGPTAWDDVSGKPTTFAPSAHTHVKGDVGLGNVDNTSDAAKPISTATANALAGVGLALDGKSDIGHTHTKSQVGLSNVDNTSDAAKPISTATQTALNNKAAATHTHVPADVGLTNVDNTSDAAKPVSTATQTALNLKANAASPAFTGTPTGLTKSHVGLANADNTSDVNKPVSTAQQTALNLKANLASPSFTGTVSGVSKGMVGLGNVDNTSDANKPISTATATALDGKADDGHNHDAAEVSTGVFDIARLQPFDITVDYVKSGGWHGAANAWPTVRPGSTAGCVNWKGPLAAVAPPLMIDGDDREYVG